MTAQSEIAINGSLCSSHPNNHFGEDAQLSPQTFQVGGIVFRRALPSDNEKLKSALRDNTMDSWVRLSLEREPSYFDGESLMGKSFTVMACDENQLDSMVGMYSCAFLPVHVNGVSKYMGYLGGLRVNQKYRYKVRILKYGYKSISHLVPNQGNETFWFTSVASENTHARRLLEAGIKGMPIYRLAGTMETLAFNTGQGKSQGLLRPAVLQDVPGLVDFYNHLAKRYQFSPVLTKEWLLNLNGKNGLTLGDFWLAKDDTGIHGCLAIWDQRAFKQTIPRGYRFPLNLFRGAYNLYAGATGRVKLPAHGEELELVFLSFVAIDNLAGDFPVKIMREGLVRAREKGAKVGIIGISDKNPFSEMLKSKLKPIIYRTQIETVSWPENPQPVLNGCPVQPEVAVL